MLFTAEEPLVTTVELLRKSEYAVMKKLTELIVAKPPYAPIEGAAMPYVPLLIGLDRILSLTPPSVRLYATLSPIGRSVTATNVVLQRIETCEPTLSPVRMEL